MNRNNFAILALLGGGTLAAVAVARASSAEDVERPQPQGLNPFAAGFGLGRLMSAGTGQPMGASRVIVEAPDFEQPSDFGPSIYETRGVAPPSKKEATISRSSGGGRGGGSSFALTGGYTPVDSAQANATVASTGAAGYFSPNAPSPNMTSIDGEATYAPPPSKKESSPNYTPAPNFSTAPSRNYTPAPSSTTTKKEESTDAS